MKRLAASEIERTPTNKAPAMSRVLPEVGTGLVTFPVSLDMSSLYTMKSRLSSCVDDGDDDAA